MKKVFVSGCYDIVHAGHIQFFEEARALGDYLIVSFASEPVLWHHKQRKPSIPDEHKKVLLESLRMVDKVILGIICIGVIGFILDRLLLLAEKHLTRWQ